jgi:uncharacterized protein
MRDCGSTIEAGAISRASFFKCEFLQSPVFARVAPFAIFCLLTLVHGQFGQTWQYWIYALKTVVAVCVLWMVRKSVKEIRWDISWGAVAVGIACFALWVGLDGRYPMFHRAGGFQPVRTYGEGSALGPVFIAVRILGSSLAVPMIEEVFYRSFLYRYFIQAKFWKVPLGCYDAKAFLITALVFGIGHYEWVPGILCGFAYQGLVCRKKRLGDAISAHAITNLLLAGWVVTREAYYFW